MIIGLTGGSGTGKSTACEYFRNKGFIIVDSDKIARQVCAKGEKCLEEIVEAFGNDILDEDGNLKRKTLGNIVFSNKKKLDILDKITHKHIVLKNMEIIRLNPSSDIVLDAPLLFEAGLGGVCTKTVCVLSDTEKRIERIMARDGISKESALARIKSQPADSFYISLCDYVIYNNSNVADLINQLENIFGG